MLRTKEYVFIVDTEKKTQIIPVYWAYCYAIFYFMLFREMVMEQGRQQLADLASPIKTDQVTRFNICRSVLWEGVRRGVAKKSFSPQSTIIVKFLDDDGTSEEAVDQGGPRREMLQLAVNYLKEDSHLFVGEDEKHLTCIQSG